MVHIAVIEDDKGLNDGIVLALRDAQYTFSQYYNLREAEDAPACADLIILDINLPDGSGFDYLKKLRTVQDTPVIVLTANDLETDEVKGLELGADDYITKPFSLMVLRARIKKVLQNADRGKGLLYEHNEFRFDFEKMQYCKNHQEIALSRTEQKLLRILVMNRNITLSRDVLLDRVWTDGAEYVDENALSVTVKRLRDKLEEDSSKPQYIRTVYGSGYVWRDR